MHGVEDLLGVARAVGSAGGPVPRECFPGTGEMVQEAPGKECLVAGLVGQRLCLRGVGQEGRGFGPLLVRSERHTDPGLPGRVPR
ncbi:hypothetical protein D9M69_659680 [compost metagenome]